MSETHHRPAGDADPHADPDAPEPEDRHTLQRQTELLLGEMPHLDAYDVARLAGTSAARVMHFWRTLGFAGVAPTDPVFARSDAEALRSALTLLEECGLTETAFRALVRAAAHSADRLAVWQVEALVDDAGRRYVLDDLSARIVVLDTVGEAVGALERLSTHAWRRHLLALLERTESAYARVGMSDQADELPLERAIGFVDVVSYTERTSQLGASELGELLEAFDERARDVLTEVGARVVKTLGDGVLFVADDLATGIEASLALYDSFADSEVPIELHGGVTWGRVLARAGDVFGPSVNLASRLADRARPGELLTDNVTWAMTRSCGLSEEVVGKPLPPATLHGIGEVEPVLLRRA